MARSDGRPFGLKAGDLGQKKAGMPPYVVLIAGLAVVLIAYWVFKLPPPAQ